MRPVLSLAGWNWRMARRPPSSASTAFLGMLSVLSLFLRFYSVILHFFSRMRACAARLACSASPRMRLAPSVRGTFYRSLRRPWEAENKIFCRRA